MVPTDDSLVSLLPQREATSAPADVDSPAVRDVKSLSASLLDLLNTRDFATSPISRHISHSVRVDATLHFGPFIRVQQQNELITLFSQVVDDNPNISCHVRSMTASVDEQAQNAKVEALYECHGVADGLMRELTCEIVWQLRRGVWVCTSYKGVCFANISLP